MNILSLDNDIKMVDHSMNHKFLDASNGQIFATLGMVRTNPNMLDLLWVSIKQLIQNPKQIFRCIQAETLNHPE